jgi:serine/threonine protein kinase
VQLVCTVLIIIVLQLMNAVILGLVLHDHGIIHTDIKPESILVGYDNRTQTTLGLIPPPAVSDRYLRPYIVIYSNN